MSVVVVAGLVSIEGIPSAIERGLDGSLVLAVLQPGGAVARVDLAHLSAGQSISFQAGSAGSKAASVPASATPDIPAPVGADAAVMEPSSAPAAQPAKKTLALSAGASNERAATAPSDKVLARPRKPTTVDVSSGAPSGAAKVYAYEGVVQDLADDGSSFVLRRSDSSGKLLTVDCDAARGGIVLAQFPNGSEILVRGTYVKVPGEPDHLNAVMVGEGAGE